MKFKSIIAAGMAAGMLLFGGCSTAASGPASAPAPKGESVSLRLGHSYGVDSLQNRAAKNLATEVEKASNGRLKIEVFPSSQLGSWEEMQEGLEVGSVDIVIESVGSLERYTNLAAVEGVPFLYKDADQFFRVWDGPIGKEIVSEIRKESGFMLLGQMYRGPRVLNSTRPVKSLSDVAGLKLRVPTQQTYIDTWKALGAAPTPLALNEVFSAIEQKAIEGQENPVDVVRFNSFFEVAPYVTNTNHLFGNFHFQMWGDKYESMDPELKKVLDDSITKISSEYRATSVKEQAENVAFLKGKGVQFFEVNHDEWAAKTASVAGAVKSDKVKGWIEQIRKA